jgi:hypothetical protein
MIDPVPELRDAHIEFVSGNPDLGESADDFGARSWAARAASVITGASSMRRLKPPTSSCRRWPKADGVAPNPARDRLYSLFSKTISRCGPPNPNPSPSGFASSCATEIPVCLRRIQPLQGGKFMERRKASDFPQELLNLFAPRLRSQASR